MDLELHPGRSDDADQGQDHQPKGDDDRKPILTDFHDSSSLMPPLYKGSPDCPSYRHDIIELKQVQQGFIEPLGNAKCKNCRKKMTNLKVS